MKQPHWILFSFLTGLVHAAEPKTLTPQTVPWTVACSSAAIPAETSPFPTTENLIYSATWGIMKAGKGTISIKGIESIDERPAYHLEMGLKTGGFARSLHKYSEHSESWLDQAWLRPVRYLKETRQSKYVRDEVNVYDPACGRYYRHDYRPDKKRTREYQAELKDPTYDILSYLFYLRTLPLEVGSKFDLTIMSGSRLWPVTARVVRKEKVKTNAGTFECFFIEPIVREKTDDKFKDLQVWISTDERRMPVKLKMEIGVGSIAVNLDSYSRT